MYRITRKNLEAQVNVINSILGELNINIDASISDGANGRVSLMGHKGHSFSRYDMPKRELRDQLATVTEILYEVSRQQRRTISDAART